MSNVRVRFAPSPTGLLHVGGARTALFNWLLARSTGGKFILRVEDTDDERNTPEANAAIFDGLRWLGLDWDEGPEAGGDLGPYRQSERKKIYDSYLSKLEKAGLTYLDDGAVRFRCPKTSRTVHDLICGDTTFSDRADEPDMTIRRPDGSYIFHFVNVVDDIEMQMTHVVRGEDHLSNTPRHLDLYEAFDVDPPQFAHIPLILNLDGSKMSKRDHGSATQYYMNQGFHPGGVANYLALLGWSPKDDQEIIPLDKLVKMFKLENVNRSNAKFDVDRCEWFSSQYIHEMDNTSLRKAVSPYLKAEKIPVSAAKFPNGLLDELRMRITKFSEAPKWVTFLYTKDYQCVGEAFEKMKTRDGVKDILKALATQFEAVKDWNAKTSEAALEKAADSLELKKGAVMFPCRVALTAQTTGFHLTVVLAHLGKEESIARIQHTLGKL